MRRQVRLIQFVEPDGNVRTPLRLQSHSMRGKNQMGAIVAGVDMVPFVKPGQQKPYREMAAEAIRGALKNAGIDARKVNQAYASYIYGSTGSGQHALYDAFQNGIPVFNVNNACCSGSTALFLARQAIMSGAADCVVAFGFEEMQPGPLPRLWADREGVAQRINDLLDHDGWETAPNAIRWFGSAGKEYLDRYDASPTLFAKIATKTRKHAAQNTYAIFRKPLSEEEVLSAPLVYGDYLTRLMCCPPSCGAAAVVLVSKSFAKRNAQFSGAVEIAGQGMASDTETSWHNPMNAVGCEMVRSLAARTYEEAGIGPDDIDVIELHDCFTPNEAMTYENLGLCAEGEASRLVADCDNTYGGKWVINPSGGLMSKGHPIGATGLAQCVELVTQLHGEAGSRNAPNARIGLQHNIGLVAGAVVTVYKKAS